MKIKRVINSFLTGFLKQSLKQGRRGLSALVLLMGLSVFAQATADALLEEVVVTATKRSESLQDISVSVNAFTGDMLDKMAVQSSNEALLRVPNLEIQSNNASSNANIYIRGMGTSGPGFNTLSGVGIYSDEVVLNSPVVNILQVFDLERIEVLRGPQNTLYGRNTTGGAVNFISRKPVVGGEANGYAKVSAGRFGEFGVEGAFGNTIGDNAAFRLGIQSQQTDGYNTNPVLGTDDTERDKLAARALFAYEPSDSFNLLAKVHMETVDDTNQRWKNLGLRDPDNPSQPCPNPIALGNCSDSRGFVDTDDNTENFANLRDPVNKIDAFGASLHMNWELENVTVTSITAYEENDYENQEDSDASPATVFHFNQVAEAEQFSQEVRVASDADENMRWIVGAYAFFEDSVGDTGPIFAAMNMVNMTRLELESTVYSAYGELEYDLSENLTLIGGLRYSYDEKEGRNQTAVRFCSEVCDSLTPTDGQDTMDFDQLTSIPFSMGMDIDLPLDDSWSEWGGKIGVEYTPTDDLMIYAHVSRGFKGGNYSAAPLQAIAGTAGEAVNPEIVEAYELGFKSTLLDGNMTANFALFFYDYTDQQVLRLTNETAFGLAAALVNVGGSEVSGAELDLQWAITEGLFLDVGLGVLDTEVQEFTDDDGNDFSGNQLTNAPEVTAYVALRKEWELASGSLLGVAGDWKYADDREFDLSNEPLFRDDSYDRLNLQVYYEFGEERQYRIVAWGKNVTDEFWFQNMSDFGDFIQVVPSAPPTYGLTLQANF